MDRAPPLGGSLSSGHGGGQPDGGQQLSRGRPSSGFDRVRAGPATPSSAHAVRSDGPWLEGGVSPTILCPSPWDGPRRPKDRRWPRERPVCRLTPILGHLRGSAATAGAFRSPHKLGRFGVSGLSACRPAAIIPPLQTVRHAVPPAVQSPGPRWGNTGAPGAHNDDRRPVRDVANVSFRARA